MNNACTLTRLETRKNALGTTRLVAAPDDGALQSGEVLMKIGRFALTTNNITYAAFGDAVMKYWQFFPTDDADWGHMPVWGFADVAASNVEGVAVGERFYGYFPIASHLRMRPVRVTARGFYDGAAHRSELVSAYNQYMRCSSDAGYVAALEDYQMLVRPLFITSFMLAISCRTTASSARSRWWCPAHRARPHSARPSVSAGARACNSSPRLRRAIAPSWRGWIATTAR